MELYNQSLWWDADWVVNRPECPSYNYEASIHPNRSGDISLERVESIDWVCDFVNNYTAYVNAVLTIDQWTYYRDIFPARNNLEVTLHYYRGVRSKTRAQDKLYHKPRRYRAIISEMTGSHLDQEHVHSMEEADQQRSEYHTFHCQLIELFVEATPNAITEGFYKNEDREEFMRGTISHGLDSIVPKKKYDYLFIDPKWENKKPIEHALLETHTKVIDIPHMVQRDFGGFYNNGIGSFHFRWGKTLYPKSLTRWNIWFVYPLYDITRYHRVDSYDKLIMWVVPDTNRSWDDYGRTYQYYPPPVYGFCPVTEIMSIYVRRVKANGEALNGNGVIKPYGIATQYTKEYMDVPIDIRENGVWGSGDRLNKEMQYDKRRDGLDRFPSHYKQNTVNYSVNASAIRENSGKRMDFVWSHADDRILMPGMPIQMHYEVNKGTVTVFGILHFYHALLVNKAKQENNNARFDCKIYMSVWVERPPHEL